MEYEGKKIGGTIVSNSRLADVNSANPSAKVNALLDALEPSRATKILLTKIFPTTYETINNDNNFSLIFKSFTKLTSSKSNSL